MRINKIYFFIIGLLISSGIVARDFQDVITSYTEKYEESLSAMMAKLQTITPSQEPYAGQPGDEYFQFYRNNIIIPALAEFLREDFLKNKEAIERISDGLLYDNADLEYDRILKILAEYRAKIDRNTKSPDADRFGEKAEVLSELIIFNDNVLNPWSEFLSKKYSILDLDFSKSISCEDALKALKNNIELKTENPLFIQIEKPVNVFPSYTVEEDIHLRLSHPDDDPNKPKFDPNGIRRGTINIGCKKDVLNGPEDFFIQFIHSFKLPMRSPIYKAASKELVKVLQPNLTDDEIKKYIARFFFFFNHMSNFSRGQASISEFWIHAIARSHGYELVFTSPDWQGLKNGSMAPDMHALSYLYEDEFVDEFMKNTKLNKIAILP